MDEREQRGLVIAATAKLRQKGETWHVPAQSRGWGSYKVVPRAGPPHWRLDVRLPGLRTPSQAV